jgi:hypothetical protein
MTVVDTLKTQNEILPNAKGSLWVERQLVPEDGVVIDTRKSFPDSDKTVKREIRKAVGADAPVVAGIRAGGNQYIVVDTHRVGRFQTPFLLIDGDTLDTKGIWPDEELVIGRNHHNDRFQYDKDISRNHFSLHYDSETKALTLSDLESQNGTFFTGYVANEYSSATERDRRAIRDNFTRIAGREIQGWEDFEPSDEVAPYGYFHKHPIIGRASSSVMNGVYGTSSSEWVVVDNEDPLTTEVVDEVLDELHELGKTPTNQTYTLLKHIETRVSEVLDYDLDEVDQMSEPHYRKKGLINLSDYIEAGVGVCRHQALLAALLIETAINENLLDGTVGVERNVDLELNGAHAWAVYRDGVHPDLIVDPANNFVGTRAEAKRRKLWRYLVSDEA